MRALVIPHVPRYLVQFAIVFISYFIAGKLGQATTNIRSSNLGPVWPAYGIALGAILLCGYRIWPAVTSAAFVVAFLSPESALTAIGQAAGSTLAGVTGVFFLSRVAKFDNSLSRLRDALALVLFGGLGSAMVSASIGTLVLQSTEVHAYSGLGSAWLIYWLGDSTGVLLVTPLVLTVPSLFRIRGWGRLTELFCLLVVLVALCAVVFNDLPITLVRMMAFTILPIVIWAAIRFGVSGAAVSMFIVATVATVETALGSGPFATSTPFINAVQLDAFFTVLSLTGLTLATLYSERERAENERTQSLRQQVAMEVRLQNEGALRASEERLRLAQQGARLATFERDVRTGRITWSEGLESLYGLPQGSLDGKTSAIFKDLIHPSDYEQNVQLIESAMKTGQPIEGEWRAIWPDGSIHWIAGRWQVLMDASGEPSRVVGVNMDITDRKLAEDKLREYERVVEGSEDMIAVVDREYRFLIANNQFLKMRNMTREQVVGHFTQEVLNSEFFEAVVKPKLHECFQGKVVTYETKSSYPGIGERDLFVSYLPIEADGGIDRAACIMHDITERKRSEEFLAGMTRKLIEAQEQERARIARELHDDINQRLAMLAVELEQLQENPYETRGRVQGVRQQLAEIASDVQALSHELHSSKLDYLGVVAGMKSWTREISARHRIEIDFSADVSSRLPLEVGRPLFRIMQEALHNSIKHSGVKRIEVRLHEHPNEIHLIVRDSGKGFDAESALNGDGLGLTSMRERARLVNGRISIESKPMGGTTIHVRIPLELKSDSQRMAG